MYLTTFWYIETAKTHKAISLNGTEKLNSKIKHHDCGQIYMQTPDKFWNHDHCEGKSSFQPFKKWGMNFFQADLADT